MNRQDHFTIRQFQQRDLEQLHRLTIASFDGVSIDQNFDDTFGWDKSPSWKQRKWASSLEVLSSSPEDSFIAESAGTIIGFVSCTISTVMGVGRIVDLAVDSSHRRAGVATRLIEQSLTNFRSKGMLIAKIETLQQNDAGQNLYPRFGFKAIANQIHYMMELESRQEET